MAWQDYFRNMFRPNQTQPSVDPMQQYQQDRSAYMAQDRSQYMPNISGPQNPPQAGINPADYNNWWQRPDLTGPRSPVPSAFDRTFRYVPGQTMAGQERPGSPTAVVPDLAGPTPYRYVPGQSMAGGNMLPRPADRSGQMPNISGPRMPMPGPVTPQTAAQQVSAGLGYGTNMPNISGPVTVAGAPNDVTLTPRQQLEQDRAAMAARQQRQKQTIALDSVAQPGDRTVLDEIPYGWNQAIMPDIGGPRNPPPGHYYRQLPATEGRKQGLPSLLPPDPYMTPPGQAFAADERTPLGQRKQFITTPPTPPEAESGLGLRQPYAPEVEDATEGYKQYLPADANAYNPYAYNATEGNKGMLPTPALDALPGTPETRAVMQEPGGFAARMVPSDTQVAAATANNPDLLYKIGGTPIEDIPWAERKLDELEQWAKRKLTGKPADAKTTYVRPSDVEVQNYPDETLHPKGPNRIAPVQKPAETKPAAAPAAAPDSNTDVAEIQAQLGALQKLWPAAPQVGGGGQGQADAFAAREMERTKALANLAFFAGITQGAGGGWEGVGRGLAAAGGAYDQGFDRYQKALQAKADRQLEQSKLDYQSQIGQLDLAYKMWNTKQTQKYGLSRIYMQQMKSAASNIMRKFNFDIAQAAKVDPMSPDYAKSQERVKELTRQRDNAMSHFYGMGVYGEDDPYNDPNWNPETGQPYTQEELDAMGQQ